MDLSPFKLDLLEALLLLGKPARATQIAEDMGQNFPPTMMHLLGLIRMGYVYSPEKSLYAITENGKKAIDIPETTRETAKKILAVTPPDKAFHFYACLDTPINCSTQSLQDFSDKIQKINVASIEFHLNRGDFEAWFTGLGDTELTIKTLLLKKKGLTGEDLRSRLHEIVENRYATLAKLVLAPQYATA